MRISNQLTSIMLLALAPLGPGCGAKETTGGPTPGVPGPAGGAVPAPGAQPPSPSTGMPPSSPPPPAPGTPPTPPPMDPPSGPVEVKSCAEVDCPKLFVETIAMCDEGRNTMCGVHINHPQNVTAYVQCFANGVKKRWSSGDGHIQTWTVTKPDGAACYTLEVTPVTGDEDAWVFRSPAGEELGRAVRGQDGLFLTCSANRKVYDVTGLDCPGLVLSARCRADATCN